MSGRVAAVDPAPAPGRKRLSAASARRPTPSSRLLLQTKRPEGTCGRRIALHPGRHRRGVPGLSIHQHGHALGGLVNCHKNARRCCAAEATVAAKTRGARRRGRNGIAMPSIGANLLPMLDGKFCSTRPEYGGDQALHPLGSDVGRVASGAVLTGWFSPSLRSFLSRAALLSGRQLARQCRGTR